MTGVLDATLVEIAARIAAGDITSVDVTDWALTQARSLQSRLNCFVRLDEESARSQAQAADAARAAGHALGPLHGVPLAHKDIYYETGKVTHCGSRVRRGHVASATSPLLMRLKAAGAINIGTLMMNEFALGPTGHNATWGDCHNAWNPLNIPGGSSSGSGTAVAARIIYGSLGSDTGGSIRIPAAANGVVGIKPTYSRLSRAHCMPLSHSLDTPGPLARTARDCARLLKVIAAHDPDDPTSSRRSVPDYEGATQRDIVGVRVGIPENYFFDHVTSDVGQAVQTAISTLQSLGAVLVRLKVPSPEPLAELSRVLAYSEASAIHGTWLRERADEYSAQVRVRAMIGSVIPASIYIEALHLRPGLLREFVTEVFDRCDVLLTPTLSIPVPTLAETDVGSGESMWRVLSLLVHCTAPFNYLGLPAISVPAGFTTNGLPASLQLVARPFAEVMLFRVAGAYQNASDWHQRSPSLM
jgi:aspartyl-tRNA(Asn)/glutamyl-tRNA(Gln) amidotransferase subunit A